MLKRQKIIQWIVSTSLAFAFVLTFIYFAPSPKNLDCISFRQDNFVSFVSENNSEFIQQITLLDYTPIFLPTAFNYQQIAPLFSHKYQSDAVSKDSNNLENYKNIILNGNLFEKNYAYSFRDDLRKNYKFFDTQSLPEEKPIDNLINVSIIDLNTGKTIAVFQEKLNIPYSLWAPIDVHFEISKDLSLSVNLPTNSSGIESVDDEIYQLSSRLKKFKTLDSGYYKATFSP